MIEQDAPSTRPQAEEFLAWYTGKTAQTKFSQISGFPPARTDLGDAVSGNPDVAMFAQALPYARLYLAGSRTPPRSTPTSTSR